MLWCDEISVKWMFRDAECDMLMPVCFPPSRSVFVFFSL